MVTRLWAGVDLQYETSSVMKRHVEQSVTIFLALGFINDQLFEVELVESDFENKETIFIASFILHNAKLRMLELLYNVLDKLRAVAEFEELEVDTDSLYLALSERNLFDCMRPRMRKKWESLRSGDVRTNF